VQYMCIVIKIYVQELGGLYVQQTDSDDAQCGQDKAGYDFIEREPLVVIPDQDYDGTDNHANQRAISGHAAPDQRKNNDWAKSSPKTCPCIADHSQYQAIGVPGQPDGNQSY